MMPTSAYRFFQLTVVLLVLYALAALVAGLKFLQAEDALLTVLPYQQANGWANSLLYLTALTGLVGGGVHMVARQGQGNRLILRAVGWLWTLVVIISVAAGALGLLEARSGLELPPVVDAAIVVVGALVLVGCAPALRQGLTPVWAIGLAVSLVGILIGLIPAGDLQQGRGWQALSVGLTQYTGLPMMALALGYWLMHRFSNLTPAWLERDIYITAALVMLAGVLVSLPGLSGMPDWASPLGGVMAVALPVVYLMIAARCYPALTRRNATHTLAAHWFVLGLVLYVLGIGLVGGVQMIPAVRMYTLGTRLSDLQSTLTLLAACAVGLGVVNQGTAELRGHNRRVTGLAPFWLVAGGILGSGLALGLAGVVQVYLERMLSVGYLDTQHLLIPLYGGWVLGLGATALGALFYAVVYRMRRPDTAASRYQ